MSSQLSSLALQLFLIHFLKAQLCKSNVLTSAIPRVHKVTVDK